MELLIPPLGQLQGTGAQGCSIHPVGGHCSLHGPAASARLSLSQEAPHQHPSSGASRRAVGLPKLMEGDS